MKTVNLKILFSVGILWMLVALLTANAATTISLTANSFLYRDSRGFWLGLPAGVKPVKTTDYPDGRTIWTNFALPAGTNLTEKSLIIVAGKYDDAAHATPTTPPTYTVDGVTFTRSTLDDQAMGSATFDIIYTWVKKNKEKVFLIFHLKSSVLGKADNDGGLKPYDQAEQIKESESVMSTFLRLESK